MNDISVSSVLAQIRALSAQAASQPQAGAGLNASAANGGTQAANGFGGLLKDSLNQVSSVQSQAEQKQRAFDLGDPNTTLSSVMLATSKAQVAFRATVEVRNRIVSAYQDIMNMPL